MANKMPEIGKKYLFREEHKSLGYMDSREMELLSIYTAGNEYWCHCKNTKWSGNTTTIKLKQFWDYFEELPSSAIQFSTKECAPGSEPQFAELELGQPKSQLSDEVQVALEKLKEELSRNKFISKRNYNRLDVLSRTIVDALESQNLSGKGDCKSEDNKKFFPNTNALKSTQIPIGCLNIQSEEKPESIWRPVSDKPKQLDNVGADIPCIVKDAQGYYTYAVFSVNAFYDLRYGSKKMELGVYHEPEEYCTLTDFINEHEQLKSDVEMLKKLIAEKK